MTTQNLYTRAWDDIPYEIRDQEITVEDAVKHWQNFYAGFVATGRRHWFRDVNTYADRIADKVHKILLEELYRQLPDLQVIETAPIPEAGATGCFVTKWSRGPATNGIWADIPWCGWRCSGRKLLVAGIDLDVMAW